MQIAAVLTLGILAWDNKRDRETAVKRYREALDLAATHTPFLQFPIPDSTKNWERWASEDVQTIRDNLNMLVPIEVVRNDARRGEGRSMLRFMVNMMDTMRDCNKCGKTDVKLLWCEACKRACCESASESRHLVVVSILTIIIDCSADCQKKDWPSVGTTLFLRISPICSTSLSSNHKAACKATQERNSNDRDRK